MESSDRSRISGRDPEEKSDNENVLSAAPEHSEDINEGLLESKSPTKASTIDNDIGSAASHQHFRSMDNIHGGEASKTGYSQKQSSPPSEVSGSRPQSFLEQDHLSLHGSNKNSASSKARLVQALRDLEQLQQQQVDVLRKVIQSSISDDQVFEDAEVQIDNTDEDVQYSSNEESWPLSNIGDVPGFEDLAGEDGMHTRCIGFLDLKLSRSFIERHMLPEALDVVNSLKADLLVLKQTTNSLHFFFWDYIFLEGEETNRTRSREFHSLVSCYRVDPGDHYLPRSYTVERPFSTGRILIIQGLTTVDFFHRKTPIPPLLSTPPWKPRLTKILLKHLDCADAPHDDSYHNMHLSFYEVGQIDIPHEKWPMGNLWRHTDEAGSPLRKSCVTFTLRRKEDLEKCEWLVVICCPSSFFERDKPDARRPKDPVMESDGKIGQISGEVAFLESVKSCVEKILERWEDIWAELNTVFERSQETSFMRPDEYAHLLYDEASFPRSRFYFWAIGCLSTFEDNIVTNLRTLQSFRQRFRDGPIFKDLQGNKITSEKIGDQILKVDNRLQELSEKLQNVAERMGKRLADVRALRDGLFSASGVMESRQSRILSENVRLLTFVSIFFLPLSFIVAFWSVPAVNATWPGVPYPIIVSTIAGIITYLIVFNLNSVTALVHSIVQKPRNFILERMAKANVSETKKSWSAKARDFEVFPRPEANPKPSEWLLIWFGITFIFRALCSWPVRLWRSLFRTSEPNMKRHKGKGVQRDDVESQPNEEVIEMSSASERSSIRRGDDVILSIGKVSQDTTRSVFNQ